MNQTLDVLNRSGHLHLEWDPEQPEEIARAREEVARLKAAGYSFFLVDDGPADEVAAGNGRLVVQRIEDPLSLPTPEPTEIEPDGTAAPVEVRRGRGRPPRTVAMQPQRGG